MDWSKGSWPEGAIAGRLRFSGPGRGGGPLPCSRTRPMTSSRRRRKRRACERRADHACRATARPCPCRRTRPALPLASAASWRFKFWRTNHSRCLAIACVPRNRDGAPLASAMEQAVLDHNGESGGGGSCEPCGVARRPRTHTNSTLHKYKACALPHDACRRVSAHHDHVWRAVHWDTHANHTAAGKLLGGVAALRVGPSKDTLFAPPTHTSLPHVPATTGVKPCIQPVSRMAHAPPTPDFDAATDGRRIGWESSRHRFPWHTQRFGKCACVCACFLLFWFVCSVSWL